MAGQSVDPSSAQSGNLDPAISYDISVSNSPQQNINRALFVTPTENYILTEQQKAFTERALAADLSTKLAPVYDRMEAIKQDIAANKEFQSKQLNENRAEYDRLKTEAAQLKASQEGMTGGSYRTLHIGYDDYMKDINTQKTSLDTLDQQLQEAQKSGDQNKVDIILNKINDTSDKIKNLMKVNPWDPNETKYATKSIETHFIKPNEYAPGWGIGGYHGTGTAGAQQRDILEGTVTGLTVGASTPATRAAEAARQAAASGQTTPDITQDYIDNVIKEFSINPFSDKFSQQDRVIASAYRQLEDPTSKYTTLGLAGIAQRMVEAGGLSPDAAAAIVMTAPQAQGSSSYNAVMNILSQQRTAQETLRAQIMTQEQAKAVKPVIASSPIVNMGEMKKPFLSVLATAKGTTEAKPMGVSDIFTGIKGLFTKTPLGARIAGTPEEKVEAQKLQDKMDRWLAFAGPSLMVSGSGVKLPAGTKVPSIFDTIFGSKLTSDIVKGTATAVIPGALTLKAGKIDRTPSGGYGAMWTDIKMPIKELTMKERSEIHPSEGLFGTKFFTNQLKHPSEIEKTQLPGALKGLTSESLMGGGKNPQAYADLMSTYSDVKTASKITTPSKETFYLIVGDKGNYQLRESGTGIGMERWSADQAEGGFDRLLNQNVDIIGSTIAKEKNPDAIIHFGDKGSLYGSKQEFLNSMKKGSINLNDPAEIKAFAEIGQQKAKSMTALQAAQSDAYQQVLMHRVEREKNLPLGSLSVQDYLQLSSSEKPIIGDTVQTINRAINPIGASAYDVKLNSTNPYGGLQFQTNKSERIAGMLSALDGTPLSSSQKETINKEIKNLPIEDAVVANKFLQTYEGQNQSYSNLSKSFENYDFSDKSRSEVLNQIKEYSYFDPLGANNFLQVLRDTDTSKKVQEGNVKVITASSETSPYTFNMILKNGKLEKSSGGQDKLQSAIAEQQEAISKIKTPSIRQQMQEALDDAVVYGKVNRELNTADPSGVKSFNSLVEGLKFATPEQKSTLKTQYTNYGEARTISEKADTLITKAPQTGISDKDLTDIKNQMNKNPVLTSIDPKTGKSYNEQIVSGLEKVKSGYWTEDDYRKAVPFDFVTGTGFSLRESASREQEAGGINAFSVGKSFLGSVLALPGTTLYGTARSFGIGGSAIETVQQSEQTKAPMPSFGGTANVGEIVIGSKITPYTEWTAPYLRTAGKFGGAIAVETLLSPITLGSLAGGNKPSVQEYNKFKAGATDYWGRVGGEILASPAEKPVTAAFTYVLGYGIGKVFEGISAFKTAKLITPQLEKNAAKISIIDEQLAANAPSKFSQRIQPVSEVFPAESSANPLARGSGAVIKQSYLEEEAAKAGIRESLYGEATKIRQASKMWSLADVGMDLAIGAPLAIPMVGDIASTSSNPEVTGQKLSNLIVMGLGASNFIGKRTLATSTLGEGSSGWASESIGLRTRMPLSEVESFHPVASIVRSPTEGLRVPFTSKEFGFKIELHNPLSKESAPSIYSTERTIQPARKMMDADTQYMYDQAVKNYWKDARAQAEYPGLTKTSRTVKIDALTEQFLKDLNRVNKKKYEKLPAGELEQIAELSARYKNIGYFEKGITPSGKTVPAEVDPGILSAELIRSGKLPEVNRLSPLGKQILYETVLEANSKTASTPLSRTLINAENKLAGRKPTYSAREIQTLPTVNERLFGEAKLENVSPMQSRILQRFLSTEEKLAPKKTLLESDKIRLVRSIQKDTSGVGLDYRPYIRPEIQALLEERKVPHAERVSKEILTTLSKYESDIYGSIVQGASKRMMKEKGLEYQPPIDRSPRDLDVHGKTPNVMAHELVDKINKAGKDDIVYVDETNNVAFTKRYSQTNDKLFDLHSKDLGSEFGSETYLGQGMLQPSRLTIVRSKLLSPEGLKTIRMSEQQTRKAKGSMIFREKLTKLTTEEGISTTGRLVSEHPGRLKDVPDYYQISLFQADLLEAKGKTTQAVKVRGEAERFIDLFGENVAKDARMKARQSKTDFLNDIGYNTQKGKINAPSPTLAVSATPRKYIPNQQAPQKYSMNVSKPPKQYNYGVSKTPSRIVSPSRSAIESRLSSAYVSPSVSRSLSPSLARSPSPSPSPSPSASPSPSRYASSVSSLISPSPSSSPSPSPSPSPSIYRSPSRYSPSPYLYPRVEFPPFIFGMPGGGGGENNKHRKRIKKFGIRQPIATAYQIMSGRGLPDFTFNMANISGSKEPARINEYVNKKKLRAMYA